MGKKWEDLTPEEQQEWNDFAVKHQKMLQLVKQVSLNGCPFCSCKFNRWVDFAFHAQSTHGYNQEILYGMMEKVSNEN